MEKLDPTFNVARRPQRQLSLCENLHLSRRSMAAGSGNEALRRSQSAATAAQAASFTASKPWEEWPPMRRGAIFMAVTHARQVTGPKNRENSRAAAERGHPARTAVRGGTPHDSG